jgi:hypothetical protein
MDALPPRGQRSVTSRVSVQTYLAIGYHMEVSPLFAVGRSLQPLSVPLQAGVRFLHDHLPNKASDGLTATFVCQPGQTPYWVYPVPQREHGSGGFRLFAGDRFVSVSAPTRRITDHVPFWLGPNTTSRVWPVLSHGVYQRFACANPSTQPSASSGYDFRNHDSLPRRAVVPRRAATLSVRVARRRYQRRTAPRLLVAEHQVILRV